MSGFREVAQAEEGSDLTRDRRRGKIVANRLAASACRDDAMLRAFVEERIGVNAWPILSRPLRKLVRRHGLDLPAARAVELPLTALTGLMRRIYTSSRRVERLLGIDNAFHHTLHNFDVALRLLLLEWPKEHPIPEDMRRAAFRAYTTFEPIEAVLTELVRRMLELGVPSWRLARDMLAAVGHDYGHSGGVDRVDSSGALLPLTHEDVAEKHVAKFGIDLGLPPALILESLAAIRATTLHLRPGREKIRAENDFQRKMMLADVAGCVKRPDLWMTRVAIPVLYERMQPWKSRLAELPEEIGRLQRRIDALSDGDGERARLLVRLAELEAEDRGIIHTVSQAFDSELRFLSFIRDYRLAALPSGRRIWGERVNHRIAMIEHLLAREDLLEPLDARGFELVEEMTVELTNADNLRCSLEKSGVHPNLRELYAEFIA